MKKAILLSLALSLVAGANATYMKLTSLGRGQTVTIKYNGTTKNVFAGELNFRNMSTNASFTTMCVDLDHFVGINQSWAFNTTLSQSMASGYRKAGNVFANNNGAVNSNMKGAALQIAVWAARYGLNLNTNTASSSNSFKLDTSFYNNNSSLINLAKAYWNTMNNNAQAIIYTPNPTDAGQEQVGCVPEPASMAALALGAATIIRRRRSK